MMTSNNTVCCEEMIKHRQKEKPTYGAVLTHLWQGSWQELLQIQAEPLKNTGLEATGNAPFLGEIPLGHTCSHLTHGQVEKTGSFFTSSQP
jgi:hypothetical protein